MVNALMICSVPEVCPFAGVIWSCQFVFQRFFLQVDGGLPVSSGSASDRNPLRLIFTIVNACVRAAAWKLFDLFWNARV